MITHVFLSLSLDLADDVRKSLCRPMSPILTLRAIRETPKLGSGAALKSIPSSHADSVKNLALKPVDGEVMDEKQVKMEDVLYVFFVSSFFRTAH